MFLHALAGAIAAAHPSIPISQELRGLIQGYSRATGKAQGLLFPEGSYQTPANVQDASAGFSRARVTPADRPSRFQGGRFVRMPYQRSPDREKSIERRKRLAATQPLRPAMAARAKLTISELAYARLIADDNLMAGDSRDCHDKMAARAGTCSRTIQRAQKHFEKLKLVRTTSNRVIEEIRNVIILTGFSGRNS